MIPLANHTPTLTPPCLLVNVDRPHGPGVFQNGTYVASQILLVVSFVEASMHYNDVTTEVYKVVLPNGSTANYVEDAQILQQRIKQNSYRLHLL